MKNYVFCCAFALLACFRSDAQTWFPEEATWHYSQGNIGWPYQQGYQFFEVLGEISVQGKVCKEVRGTCACSPYGNINYLCPEGDKVWRYDMEGDSFSILYDFTLQPGDSLPLALEHYDMSFYLLDSVTQIIVNGVPVRVQHFSYIEGSIAEISSVTYEYFGNNQCLYPQIGVCDPGTGVMRCYEDFLFGLQMFNGFEQECDAIISSTADPGVALLEVSPNPASDYIEVKADGSLQELTIVDIVTGKVIRRDHSELIPNTIDLTQFAPGTYLLQARQGERFFSRRLAIIR